MLLERFDLKKGETYETMLFVKLASDGVVRCGVSSFISRVRAVGE